MITTYYPPYSCGGDGAFVHSLANALADDGHEVEVIHCVDAYRLQGKPEVARALPTDGRVKVHPLRSRAGAFSPLATQQTGYPFFKRTEVQRILRHGFDVIHYHNLSLIGPKVVEYGAAIKLYTAHEYWLICQTHMMYKFNRELCRKRECIRCSLSYGRPPQWWRWSGLLESTAGNIDAWLAPSHACSEMHRDAGFPGRFTILPGFAAKSHGSRGGFARPDAEPYFLYAGRLERLKGLQTLIPIFRETPDVRLVVAGTGSSEGSFRDLAADCRNIEFLGHVSRGRLTGLYRGAVALLVPSQCLETFSLVTIEAFQERTPVIATRLGGPAEILSRSGGGMTYTREEELRFAMKTLLHQPALRKELGDAGFAAYRKYWTAEAHLENYYSVIKQAGRTHAASRRFLETPDGDAHS
jgi:glycosyltransferase involved in cell wall biosynthesis